jgi:hypothetical protein
MDFTMLLQVFFNFFYSLLKKPVYEYKDNEIKIDETTYP